MVRELLLNQLSSAINRILATDPLAFDAIKKHHAKTLLIECSALKTPLYVSINPYGLQLKSAHEGLVTVSISGKLGALLQFAKSPDQTKMLMDEQVKLCGEIDFLLKLKQIALNTDLDIEGLIAEYVGDMAATQLSSLAKGLFNQVRTSLQSLSTTTTLYLQEESQLLPSAVQVEQFILDVNQLRQDLDRLSARTHRLSRGIN